ncbi:otoancorin [Osmerus mordax]|uniref:otoancorin n=1 Tax=Osmerus mordax TaxID=8014 RepID=UPI00350EA65B
MMQCLGMGYQVPPMVMMYNVHQLTNTSGVPAGDKMSGLSSLPIFLSLLSSLPPPDSGRLHIQPNKTMEYPDQEWNMTEKMWNCSSLPGLIKLMKNSSDGPVCFFRALVAPLSWTALTMTNGSNLDLEDYGRLVWAAWPFLQNMAPLQMGLPASIQRPHLQVMMKMMRNVFGSLTEGQQDQIKEWVREQIGLNYFNCSLADGSHKPDQGKPKTHVSSSPPRCSKELQWLKVEGLKTMGPFLTRLSLDDIKTIPKDQICNFLTTPDFSSSFRGVARINSRLGRKFLEMVKDCSKEGLIPNVDRLGSLACFYGDAPTLNSSLSRKLLSQLSNCSNSDVKELKKRLVNMLMTSPSPGDSLLSELGPGVTALPSSFLAQFSISALQDTLASLGPKAKWSVSQAKALASKLLQGKESVTNLELVSLGPAVRGVASRLLRKVKALGLLGSEGLQSMSQSMTKLQKTALLEGFRKDTNASELVRKVPAALLSSLSLSTLDQANFTSFDQLDGKTWTRAQAAFLVKKIIGKTIKPAAMWKLGWAMQGVACDMINQTTDSDAMDMAIALTDNPQLLTRAQVCCAARRLFGSLEKVRAGYFRNLTEDELNLVPTILLLHLQAPVIKGLPASVCSAFLVKMGQANLSSVPLRSPSRQALTSRALSCLLNGRNMSELSSDEVLSLGSLLCEVSPSQLTLLSQSTLNSSLPALASCSHIPPLHRTALLQLLNHTYGAPSNWSADTTVALAPLLLLDDSTVRSLRYRSWLKATLSDLLDSMPAQQGPPGPSEYSSALDLSTLRWKLFSLCTSPEAVSPTATPARRRRAASPLAVLVPLAAQIEDLGPANVYWSPDQLSAMSNDTFITTADTLGAVTTYSSNQLSVLRQKVIEAWGPVANLNESQVVHLACICQGFNLTELSSLPISSLDTLEALAPCSWTQTQREMVWKCYLGRCGMTVGQLTAVEIVGLNQFVCGFSTNETTQINADVFREAVGSLGNLECPLMRTEKLKERAVALFGAPSSWSQAQVNTLGNIIAGLTSAELNSLSSSVLPFLSRTGITLIPPDRLAALPSSQLEALGPDNAAMVTDAQRAMLGVEQKAALDNALGLPAPRAISTTPNPPVNLPQQSGASTLGTLGLGVYLQPCLVLLLLLVL